MDSSNSANDDIPDGKDLNSSDDITEETLSAKQVKLQKKLASDFNPAYLQFDASGSKPRSRYGRAKTNRSLSPNRSIVSNDSKLDSSVHSSTDESEPQDDCEILKSSDVLDKLIYENRKSALLSRSKIISKYKQAILNNNGQSQVLLENTSFYNYARKLNGIPTRINNSADNAENIKATTCKKNRRKSYSAPMRISHNELHEPFKQYNKADGLTISNNLTPYDIYKEEILSRQMGSNISDPLVSSLILNKPPLYSVVDDEWSEGDICWGRIGSYPYWPCLICDDPETGSFVRVAEQKGGRRIKFYHVRFFADNGRSSEVKSHCLFPFKNLEDFKDKAESITPEMRHKSPRHCSAFIVPPTRYVVWKNAIDEATLVMKRPKIYRLDYFTCSSIQNSIKLFRERTRSTGRTSTITKSSQLEANSNDVFDQLLNSTTYDKNPLKQKFDDDTMELLELPEKRRKRMNDADKFDVKNKYNIDSMGASTSTMRLNKQSSVGRKLGKTKFSKQFKQDSSSKSILKISNNGSSKVVDTGFINNELSLSARISQARVIKEKVKKQLKDDGQNRKQKKLSKHSLEESLAEEDLSNGESLLFRSPLKRSKNDKIGNKKRLLSESEFDGENLPKETSTPKAYRISKKVKLNNSKPEKTSYKNDQINFDINKTDIIEKKSEFRDKAMLLENETEKDVKNSVVPTVYTLKFKPKQIINFDIKSPSESPEAESRKKFIHEIENNSINNENHNVSLLNDAPIAHSSVFMSEDLTITRKQSQNPQRNSENDLLEGNHKLPMDDSRNELLTSNATSRSDTILSSEREHSEECDIVQENKYHNHSSVNVIAPVALVPKITSEDQVFSSEKVRQSKRRTSVKDNVKESGSLPANESRNDLSINDSVGPEEQIIAEREVGESRRKSSVKDSVKESDSLPTNESHNQLSIRDAVVVPIAHCSKFGPEDNNQIIFATRRQRRSRSSVKDNFKESDSLPENNNRNDLLKSDNQISAVEIRRSRRRSSTKDNLKPSDSLPENVNYIDLPKDDDKISAEKVRRSRRRSTGKLNLKGSDSLPENENHNDLLKSDDQVSAEEARPNRHRSSVKDNLKQSNSLPESDSHNVLLKCDDQISAAEVRRSTRRSSAKDNLKQNDSLPGNDNYIDLPKDDDKISAEKVRRSRRRSTGKLNLKGNDSLPENESNDLLENVAIIAPIAQSSKFGTEDQLSAGKVRRSSRGSTVNDNLPENESSGDLLERDAIIAPIAQSSKFGTEDQLTAGKVRRSIRRSSVKDNLKESDNLPENESSGDSLERDAIIAPIAQSSKFGIQDQLSSGKVRRSRGRSSVKDNLKESDNLPKNNSYNDFLQNDDQKVAAEKVRRKRPRNTRKDNLKKSDSLPENQSNNDLLMSDAIVVPIAPRNRTISAGKVRRSRRRSIGRSVVSGNECGKDSLLNNVTAPTAHCSKFEPENSVTISTRRSLRARSKSSGKRSSKESDILLVNDTENYETIPPAHKAKFTPDDQAIISTGELTTDRNRSSGKSSSKESSVINDKSTNLVGDCSDCISECDIKKRYPKKFKTGIFQGLSREPVCIICGKPNELFKCKGPCSSYYHYDCVFSDGSMDKEKTVVSKDIFEKHASTQMEEIMNYVIKLDTSETSSSDGDTDDDEIGCKIKQVGKISFDTNFIVNRVNVLKCSNCVCNKKPKCFICQSNNYENEKKSQRHKCCINGCGKFFHFDCLKIFPQTKISFGGLASSKNNKKKTSDSFVCAHHVCHTCVSDNPKGNKSRFLNEKLTKCIKCPTAYHMNVHCIPAGTRLLTASQIICTKHFDISKKSRVGIIQHLNINWCFICSIGGSLICCEMCPTSFHVECLGITQPEGKYICEDCEAGRFPLYNEVVWCKMATFRWWPARILPEYEIPPKLLKVPREPGNFCVRFFGSLDHHWSTRGKVFLFCEGDTNYLKTTKNNLDEVFDAAIKDASVAYKEFKEARALHTAKIEEDLKPPYYIKIKTNQFLGNTKAVDLDHSISTPCECDPRSLNPCGPYSYCLNRVLQYECNPMICPAGSKCCNQSFVKRQYPPLSPFVTKGKGWGLKTCAKLRSGQFVAEYVGDVIDHEEFNRRLEIKHKARDENFYFLVLDKDRIIDAGPKGNVSRFMNHSCEPNCETQKWTVNGDTRIGLFAIKDIEPGTELTFNYNLESFGGEGKKICNCGAATCAGFIGAKKSSKKKKSN